MKLLDVMRQYNKAVLRENAKLKSIYNTLIREAQTDGLDVSDVAECDVAECDGENCEGTKPVAETKKACADGEREGTANEGDVKEGLSVSQFFSGLLEGEGEKKCADDKECKECDTVNEEKLDGKVFDDNLKKEVLPESEKDQEDEKKAEEKPTEEKSAEEKPAEEAPAAEEKPAEAPAAAEEAPDAEEAPAAEENPAEEAPATEEKSEEKAEEAPAAEEKPVEEE